MPTSPKKWTLADLATYLDAKLVGDPELEISGLGSLETAQAGQLSHLSNASYKSLLATTHASAVILAEDDVADSPCAALVASNPYLAFARVSHLFAKPSWLAEQGAAPQTTRQAYIHPEAQVDPSAVVGSGAFIGPSTQIAAGVVIHPNAHIGARCILAEHVTVHAGVAIQDDVEIGARSVIHSGAVVGASGFGYTPDEQGHYVEIKQIGGVEIGEDVSIGANTTIDCGAIDNTVIGNGVKIDNQVQIGHNCHIGEHTLICGCVGIVGSTKIGKHCVLAGGSGVGGDRPIELCDGVVVTATTLISQSIDKPGVYSSAAMFHSHQKWRRNALRQPHLDELFRRVRRIEKTMENK